MGGRGLDGWFFNASENFAQLDKNFKCKKMSEKSAGFQAF